MISDFLLDYKKNYGVNAKGRYINYIVLIYQIIIEKIIDLHSITSIEIILDFLKNQILDYKNIFFDEVSLLKDQLNCPHFEIEPELEGNKFKSLNFSCRNCEKNKIKLFLKIFKSEILSIKKSSISNNLVKKLNYVYDLKDLNNLDGRKHICINLVDLFLILNCPKNFIILTSNYSHFKDLCTLLNKKIDNPLS